MYRLSAETNKSLEACKKPARAPAALAVACILLMIIQWYALLRCGRHCATIDPVVTVKISSCVFGGGAECREVGELGGFSLGFACMA